HRARARAGPPGAGAARAARPRLRLGAGRHGAVAQAGPPAGARPPRDRRDRRLSALARRHGGAGHQHARPRPARRGRAWEGGGPAAHRRRADAHDGGAEPADPAPAAHRADPQRGAGGRRSAGRAVARGGGGPQAPHPVRRRRSARLRDRAAHPRARALPRAASGAPGRRARRRDGAGRAGRARGAGRRRGGGRARVSRRELQPHALAHRGPHRGARGARAAGDGRPRAAQPRAARGERLATLGQMAATIAHELGTPLNSVLGFTQLLRREQPTPAQAEKLAIVESQVQRMIETIRSVLDRTRDRELVRKPVAVGPLVTEALSLVSTSLASRGVVALSEVPADLPPVPGDAVALRQVLLNLLTNAIDAIDGAGTIRVSAAVLPGNGSGGRRLEVAVADSGHGMSAEELRHAFEPFYTTKAPGRGTGI